MSDAIDWSKVVLPVVQVDAHHERVPGERGIQNMDPDRWKEMLDAGSENEKRRARGLTEVSEPGMAVAIVKLGYPYEIVFHSKKPKARPHDLTLWAPEWIVFLLHRGMGEAIRQCIDDENLRNTLVEGLKAMKNLKDSK